MIRKGLLEAVQTKRKIDMPEVQQPIPEFERIMCPTCGRTSVAEKGTQSLCQNCVNEFLAKNVGLMQAVPEASNAPAPAPVGEFIPKT